MGKNPEIHPEKRQTITLRALRPAQNLDTTIYVKSFANIILPDSHNNAMKLDPLYRRN
jgi:hypothetical protein